MKSSWPPPVALDVLEVHRLPAERAERFSYGTAGFRCNADLLDGVLLRMGMLATVRSMHRGGLAVGLMVTASHNPECDNGVKMVDADGGMLDMSWESHAEMIANADAAKDVVVALRAVVEAEGIDVATAVPRIFVARDTRSSSERLMGRAVDGALAVGGNVADFGLLTTPQLHYMVHMYNSDDGRRAYASEGGYYNLLERQYQRLVGRELQVTSFKERGATVVDCAHGVGAVALVGMPRTESLPRAEDGEKKEQEDGAVKKEEDKVRVKDLARSKEEAARGKLKDRLEKRQLLQLSVRNLPGDDGGVLNAECGAEFVQKKRLPPVGLVAEGVGSRRCCSFDGDADRVVYHYRGKGGSWHLLDGDKIAALWAVFLKELLQEAKVDPAKYTMGVVQTAYANGSSSEYMRAQGVQVVMAKTGVKFVHRAACGHHGDGGGFDVGLYFEANGHGTVVFKRGLVEHIQGRLGAIPLGRPPTDPAEKAERLALERLLTVQQLVNQAVGDAVTNMLFTEAILTIKAWTMEDWDAIYLDLPSRQAAVHVRDRSAITCSADETQATAPPGLQDAIAAAATAKAAGRAFVRPSGTENVVRVYAEAATEDDALDLARQVVDIVYDMAGGVGEKPELGGSS